MTEKFHTSTTFHPLSADGIVLPQLFNNPFHYKPHPLCIIAAEEVKRHIAANKTLSAEADKGKMFGVLVGKDQNGTIGFFAAFSGILGGKNYIPYFVPPVFDLQNPEGHFAKEEKNISEISNTINEIANSIDYQSARKEHEAALLHEKTQMEIARQRSQKLKARRDALRASATLTPEKEAELMKESQYTKAELKRLERTLKADTEQTGLRLKKVTDEIERLKQERKQRSASLQEWLFRQFVMLNALGEKNNLIDIFWKSKTKIPPAGSGECCAPKLLQHAYIQGITPICMAEFWLGESPKEEIRNHGAFYPSCTTKCKPILQHMLKGINVEENLQKKRAEEVASAMRIIYEDKWICVIDKPAGMLTVPSKEETTNVYSKFLEMRPEVPSTHTIVHRLDMDTSGIVLLAKDRLTHKVLQEQFARHIVKKKYIAIIDGVINSKQGTISLPLSPDIMDRPRQKVDYIHGKTAITHYEVVPQQQTSATTTRITFTPITGRTHQLRVHSAHKDGLGHPIMGDPLYGTPSTRLYLHAESIEFTHPATKERMTIKSPCPF